MNVKDLINFLSVLKDDTEVYVQNSALFTLAIEYDDDGMAAVVVKTKN